MLMGHRVDYVVYSDPNRQASHLLGILRPIGPLPRIADIGIERNHHHQPVLVVVNSEPVRRGTDRALLAFEEVGTRLGLIGGGRQA